MSNDIFGSNLKYLYKSISTRASNVRLIFHEDRIDHLSYFFKNLYESFVIQIISAYHAFLKVSVSRCIKFNGDEKHKRE